MLSLRTTFKDRDSRKLLVNVGGNYLVKGGALLVSLLIMPAYMRYFSSDSVLGMWFTLTQLLSWIMLLDFGVGGGLRNKIVKPLAEGDKHKAIALISSAYFAVTIVVAILLVLSFCIIDKLNWYTILKVAPSEISENTLIKMVQILTVGICVRFFSVLVSNILYALQKATLPGIINLMSNVLILLYLLLAKPTGNESDIITLSYVNALANNIPAMLATVWVFAFVLKGMWPRIRSVKRMEINEVMGIGWAMFYLQIVIMILFNVKEIYITWFVNSAAVVEYQVYYKLIGMIGGLYSLALTPVWSAVTKALVEKKQKWIRDLYKKGVFLIVIFGVIQLLLVALMPIVVDIWLKENSIEVSRWYGLIFCVYNIVFMWMMLNYNFACGIGRTKVISVWLTVSGIANLLLTMVISVFYRSWISVIIATAITTIPCAAFVQIDIFKSIKNMKNSDGKLTSD